MCFHSLYSRGLRVKMSTHHINNIPNKEAGKWSHFPSCLCGCMLRQTLIILLMWWWGIWGRTSSSQGWGLTVHWPVFLAGQMWVTVAGAREVYPDDVGFCLVTSPCLGETKMEPNLPCLDAELVSAPHWSDCRTPLNISLKRVCARARARSPRCGQVFHSKCTSRDIPLMDWSGSARQRKGKPLFPCRNQPQLEPHTH